LISLSFRNTVKVLAHNERNDPKWALSELKKQMNRSQIRLAKSPESIETQALKHL